MTRSETATPATPPRAGAPSVYPALGYRDARAAIAWLCEAFGFAQQMVHPGEDGREIAHAELSLGAGIVMLGSQRNGAPTAGEVTAAALGDGEVEFARIPFSLYIAIADVDHHCERARAAGAEIVHDPADTPYGSREYACRDLEGNVWSFGTYQPVGGEGQAG